MLKKIDRWLLYGVWALLVVYLAGRLYHRFVVGVCTDVLNPLLYLAVAALAVSVVLSLILRRRTTRDE